MEKKTSFLLLSALLLFAFSQSVLATENIAELKIESLTTPIRAGEILEFTFFAGNKLGPPCSGYLQYWFEIDGKRAIQGNDTVYLETGETRIEQTSLIMPPGLEGVRDFYIEMQCNEALVLASRIIHISTGTPNLPLFTTLDVMETDDGKQAEFLYALEASQNYPVTVQIEEQIIKDNNVLWTNTQNIAVTGITEIKRIGPILPPGNYRLIVEAKHGNETAKITREFTVGAVALLPMQNIAIGAALVLLFLMMIAMAVLVSQRLFKNGLPFLTTGFHKGGGNTKKRVCNVESDSAGVPGELELSQLLDAVGFTGKKRRRASLFAGRTPLKQVIRGCVVTDKKNRSRCETTVTVSVSNNTNRNWKNLVVLAEIPEFLCDGIGQIESEEEMDVLEEAGAIKFKLTKVGAMQSASFSYKSETMISQAEANSVPLPAVIGYRKGKPLVIAQVRVEKQAEETPAKSKGKAVEKIRIRKKRIRKKKAKEAK